MLTAQDFKSDVKAYLRMSSSVTAYDEELSGLIEAAIASLKTAGVKMVKNPLLTEYVNTYVRKRMLQDASEAFKRSETEREKILIQQLTYGGE